MRLHRFYTPFQDLIKAKPGTRLVLDTAESEAHKTDYKAILHQWKDVFNYTAGSQVLLFDGKGDEVLALIEDLGWAHAELVVIEKRKEEKKNKSEVGGTWLFASIVKGDNFDFIIQKTTELGVDHIVPILSDRTIKKNINLERARKIAIEASEQCGRATVPDVYKPVSLDEALESFVKAGGNLYICAEKGKKWSEVFKNTGAIGFAIGPEGGWSDREEMYFKRQKLSQVSLGKNVLRAETGAIAVMVLASIS
jgi:16S rRNA (uracil1498-N3)-methyltransferase